MRKGEVNKIGGYYAFGKEIIDGDQIYDVDPTKLSIHTRDIGLTGKEVYDKLRDDYDIQIELGDVANILAIISVGDRELSLERLIGALAEIKRLDAKPPYQLHQSEYINPVMKMTPQAAFYSETKSMPLSQSVGQVSGEFVMCYPPGIPLLAPGELITQELVEHINFAKEKGCFLTGSEDLNVENIKVVV